MEGGMSQQFTYSAWANRQIAQFLQLKPGFEGRPLQIFSHLLATEKVWLYRIQAKDLTDVPIWPDLSLSACVQLLDENAIAYQSLLLGHLEASNQISYRNSKGIPFQTSLGDILQHVVLHGCYHRGQIAAAVRSAGVEPVNTDFITFVRQTAFA
jgi:uncharacterized damage-inducible protein DinB